MNLNDPKTYSDFKWLFVDIPESTRKWVKNVK